MAISEMKLVRAVGNRDYLDPLIRACCVGNSFQPEQAVKHLSASLGFAPLNEENAYAPLLQKIEELAENSGFQLKKQPLPTNQPFAPETHAYIGQLAEQLSGMHDERKALTGQLETCENAVEQYQHFTGLGIDLAEIFRCSFIKLRFGHMPKDSAQKLAAYADNPYMLFIPCSSDGAYEWGVYFAPREHADEIDGVFASLFFERLRVPNAVGTPEEIIAELEKNIQILKDQLAELDQNNRTFWNSEAEHCNQVYSQLSFLSEHFDLRKYAAVHGASFFYVGWMPTERVAALEQRVKGIPSLSLELDDPEQLEGYDPPVRLKNRRIFRPFEYIVSMFGMPAHGDVDITAFVAITYTVLFGIMFGDVGQGIVLALAGVFMWKRMNMPIGKILLYCGASAAAGGFVYGSLFGYESLLDPLYHAIGLPGKPVRVMESTGGLLLFSIGIAISLLVISMGVNIYAKCKCREWGEALFGQNGLAGMLFYLGIVCFVAGLMTDLMGARTPVPVPRTVYTPVIASAAVCLFFKEILIALLDRKRNWKPEKWSDFILENLFELFEYVISFFSNTLSFLRVGAFVFVHGCMMLAVFSIAKSDNLVAILIGNLLVIVLEALFTSIQAMRLNFYEIFSRCYTGEGREFEPVRLS